MVMPNCKEGTPHAFIKPTTHLLITALNKGVRGVVGEGVRGVVGEGGERGGLGEGVRGVVWARG